MNFWILFWSLSQEDQEFVIELYHKHKKYMYKKAYDILMHKEDTEDAVQQAMCNIMQHLSKFKGRSDEEIRNRIAIGIRAIIRNSAYKIYNKRKKRMSHEMEMYFPEDENGEYEEMEFEDEDANVEEIIINKENSEIIRKALLNLSQDMQDAISLVYFEDFSTDEAASYLKIKGVTLRVTLTRARRKLGQILVKEESVRA